MDGGGVDKRVQTLRGWGSYVSFLFRTTKCPTFLGCLWFTVCWLNHHKIEGGKEGRKKKKEWVVLAEWVCLCVKCNKYSVVIFLLLRYALTDYLAVKRKPR